MRGDGYAVLNDPDRLTAGQSEAFENLRRTDGPQGVRMGYSNARLGAFDNRIKVTVRMAYGFHRVTNLIALVMPRCGGLDIRLPQPAI